MVSFATRLRELRSKRKLRQKDMAKKLGITESAYGYYEQGRSEPPYETLHQLAQFFDVSLDYLLGITDDPSGNLKEVDQVDVKKVLQKEKAHWGGYEIPEEDKETIQRVLEAIIRREEEAATKES